ncbi:MAG TPA: hypothetical protein VG276_28805 [Actinomycetes bacterium]|jgi:hypothetical protein|nr:hypothetical protein [Actinomycetes bacterium]
MSWSLHVGTVRPATITAIEQAAGAALAELRAKGPSYAGQFDAPETAQEVAEQVQAATSAAGQLLSGLGVVEEVTVNLSGHANPGHQPRPGWAPDQVTVTVNAVEAPKES